MVNYEIPSVNIGGAQEQEKRNLDIEKIQRRERRIALTKECSESGERFPFPGINSHSYAKLKAEEEEFPGFVTLIDELIERFKQEGMKVSFGIDPKSGNILVLPFGSEDIKYESILPKHLDISEDMDERLKELIMLSRV
ncbi:MAG: hypothetical protein WC819_01485 [Parcubacteria group bacterium]|jgi:hypothetical protein